MKGAPRGSRCVWPAEESGPGTTRAAFACHFLSFRTGAFSVCSLSWWHKRVNSRPVMGAHHAEANTREMRAGSVSAPGLT